VLSGLGLLLAHHSQDRHQADMHADEVALPHLQTLQQGSSRFPFYPSSLYSMVTSLL